MGELYGFGSSSNRSVRGDEDFEEEDVWAVMKERKEGSPNSRKGKDFMSPAAATRRLLPSASRMIPPKSSSSNNASWADDDGGSGNMGTGDFQQSSAPVNIPDWSKIYMMQKNKGFGSSDHGGEGYDGIVGVGDEEDEDGDDEDDRVPPHEWIAKKLARSQISSFSVCEGAGRTLKGRDLRKVRNAVLTRTGFLEK